MGDHYYTSTPGSVSEEREISYMSPAGPLTFLTDKGVFSGNRVDFGSDLLIKAVAKDFGDGQAIGDGKASEIIGVSSVRKAPSSLLDIGCGYGPIGLSLGMLWPECRLCMSDVNERAMNLAKRNALALHRDAEIAHNETEKPEGPFELVVTNPPIRAGKQTVYGIFAQAHEALAKGGLLYVVIQKKQGADSAVKELMRLFGNCETIARDAGFHILRVEKND